MAIDEIELDDCETKIPDEKYSPNLLKCSFEKDFCSYKRKLRNLEIGDIYSLSWTGPEKPYSGKFCYLKKNLVNYLGSMQSPFVKLRDNYCLSFAYYMYGADVGIFTVQMLTFRNNETVNSETIFERTGNQGYDWLKFHYSLPPTPADSVKIKKRIFFI